ncbi:AMP-binding protein, partial [Seohaeicola saemankumensis]
MMQTLADLIQRHPETAKAIGAPGRDWMTYGQLNALTRTVRTFLRGAGVGAQDRVAIVLPNGPEMAAAFIAVAQSATTAPLNPAYKEDEFAFYLEDLKARAIILEAGYNGPARAAARRFGLTVIELTATEPAGMFTLLTDVTGTAADTAPTADDVALILHTSGTTSRPKIVPLLQSNVAASAENIRASLALTAEDCCLNVMPLFHIHGLVAAVSASLAAGASISCTPG